MTTFALELLREDKPVLYRKFKENIFSIGRHYDNELCLPDPSLPDFLCRVTFKERKYVLENLSAEGVFINQEVLFDSMTLAQGDVLCFGAMQARVVIDSGRSPTALAKTKSLSDISAKAVDELLVRIVGQHADSCWAIGHEGVSVGTRESCDIVLDDSYVSGVHARLYRQGGRYFAEDLRSRNGLLCNEIKMIHGEISAGMRLQIGHTRLELFSNSPVVDRGNVQKRNIVPLIGSSKVMQALRYFIGKISGLDVPVLICGETGTGKEVVAQQIYAQSKRHNKPFIVLNSSTLNPHLIASELFGHRKGAFTGALESKKGAFEAADQGTLFLDEIGELPLELQAQLLRVLESGEIRRVGESEAKNVDVRLIAATNRDLRDEVRQGRFREDLYHRLNVVEVTCPPLRERLGDLPELVAFLLAKISPQTREISCGESFMRALAKELWPGNIRQLNNALQQALIFCEGAELQPCDLNIKNVVLQKPHDSFENQGTLTLAEIERQAIVSELVARSGNKKESAAALGISRSTIHRKIEEYQIEIETSPL
ncbi:MAG: sigma 54-interacting transcriptional regulator [Myxococcota bacterium]|nr:sigma 54-interacting transcriptional regulator [Myxococcota bacterium]